jgi:hypothetical protein
MKKKRAMPIREIGLFAYRTKGEALAVANRTVEETVVAEIVIILNDKPAQIPVAFVVLPAKHYPL